MINSLKNDAAYQSGDDSDLVYSSDGDSVMSDVIDYNSNIRGDTHKSKEQALPVIYLNPDAQQQYSIEKYTDTKKTPLQRLEDFVTDHLLLPQTRGGNGSGHNYDWAIETSKFKSHKIVGIPNDRVPLLHELMTECSEADRLDISERVNSKNFKMFFDVDWKIENFAKNIGATKDSPPFPFRGQEARDFFLNLKDTLLEAIDKTIQQVNATNHVSVLGDDLPSYALDTDCVVLSRTCYKYHIIYPNIRTNVSTMKMFQKSLLGNLPTNDYFAWSSVIDMQPYSGALRMAGCSKSKLKIIMGGDEGKCHNFIFKNEETDEVVDIYRYAYYGPNKLYNQDLLQSATLHSGTRPGEDNINFEILTGTVARNQEGELVEELFFGHTDQMIRDRVMKAVFDMNSTGMISSGTDFSVIGEITSWKQLSGKQLDEVGVISENDCYLAHLPPQSCPFKGGMHKRTQENNNATLYCLLFESRVVLQCHDCTKLDEKAKRIVSLEMGPDEVDYLKQADLAAQSVVNRSHEAIASVIFNWVKHRVATSPTNSRGGGRTYQWYFFSPKFHIWRQSDKRIVDDIMGINGLVQTKYKEIQKEVLENYKEDKTGKKKKALLECMKKLFKMLQNSPVQGTIMPLIGRKLAAYYEELDPQCRPFAEQLDDKPWLLATKNGVIDFRQGGICRPGRPDDYLSTSTHNSYFAWDKLDKAWQRECKKYYELIFPVKAERDYVLWCFARMLNGERRRHCMYFMLGNGSDGKSVLFSKIFKKMLGKLSGDGQPTLVVGNDDKGSSGPRTDLVHIKGKRTYGLTEPNPKDILNTGRVKQITGGDVVSAAEKNEKQQEIVPQCTFFMVLNNKIRIESPPNDDGTWRRIMFIFFRHRFRTTAAKLTGCQYESVGIPDSELAPQIERLAVSSLSYFVYIYQKTERIAEWPEPEAFARIRESIREENDIWLKYINEVTRPSKENETGLTVAQLWTPFPEWLKARGSSKRTLDIDKFAEFMSTHLGETLILDPSKPMMRGWRRMFTVPINAAGKFAQKVKVDGEDAAVESIPKMLSRMGLEENIDA